jgi:hypothetical protein
MQVEQRQHVDPTVCSAVERAQIEHYYGVSMNDTAPEVLQFVVERSKQAGNQAFKHRNYAGKLTMTASERSNVDTLYKHKSTIHQSATMKLIIH